MEESIPIHDHEGGGDPPPPPPPPRRPVVFIPPFAGVRLQQRLHDREVLNAFDLICQRDTEGDWIPAWLPDGSILDALRSQCYIENIALPPPRGVEVRVEESFDACMWLDVGRKDSLWGQWAEQLQERGWVQDETLFALPMDWRHGPDSWAAPGGAFDRLAQLIERAVEVSSSPAVVVSMSMGGPFFALFCSQHVSEAWKLRHIQTFVSVSGVYGGSSSPLLTLFSGKWGSLIPSILQPFSLKTARTFASLPWLLPSDRVFSSDRVWIRTKSRNFTASELPEALELAGAYFSANRTRAFASLAGQALAPNVTTFCFFGAKLPTIEALEWNEEELRSPPDSASMGMGDGTVLAESLSACMEWAKVQRMPVKNVTWDYVAHTDMLKWPPVFKKFFEILVG